MTFTATLKPSGKQFSIEDGCTVLDAARTEKISLAHSCRDGSCGTCKAKLLQGEVTYPEDMEGITEQELSENYILTCVSKPESDIEIESDYFSELEGIEPAIFPCKVAEIGFPAQEVLVLNLRLPPDSNFQYLPGQYIDLMWKGHRRSYSIANAECGENGIELHVRRVPGGVFSQLLFEELKPQALLRLHGPHGTFFVRENDSPILFLAGGTGFAPVKAMVQKLLEDETQRRIHIYWGISEAGLLYDNCADQWQKDHENITFTPVLSCSDVKWTGRQGLVHQAVLQDIKDLSGFEVYACGSVDMITAAKSDFLNKGLDEHSFFADAFTPHKPTK